jgi:hypothetical protein
MAADSYTYTFIEHTIEYPPPGLGWVLFQVVSISHGGGSYDDFRYERGGKCVSTMPVSTQVVGIWTRPRTDGDKARERAAFGRSQGSYVTSSDEYPEWLRSLEPPAGEKP